MDSPDRDNFFDRFVDRKKIFDKQDCIQCFQRYDVDRDGYLNKREFRQLLSDIFCDGSQPYKLTEEQEKELFTLLDQDQDGKISKTEFLGNCYYWLKQILQPNSALIVVDVQNDFLDGNLALRNCPAGQDGLGVIPAINSVLDTVNFELVVYTRDWHPEDHISFAENKHIRPFHSTSQITQKEAKVHDTVIFEGPPMTEQRLWPTHCVQGSWGAEIHTDLKVPDNSVFVDKGKNPNVDSYSAFWDNNKHSQTELVQILSKHNITDVYLCGVAYDVCVGFTGLDAMDHGFRVVALDDACRGVDIEKIDEMKKSLQEKGAIIISTCKVKDIVEGSDRPPKLGIQTARNVALARTLVNNNKVHPT